MQIIQRLAVALDGLTIGSVIQTTDDLWVYELDDRSISSVYNSAAIAVGALVSHHQAATS